MARLLDGVQAVRYTAPKPASTPVRYTASTMLNTQQQTAANRYQAQADAYKKQQQEAARQAEAQRLAAQQAEYQRLQQQKQFNQSRQPVTNNLVPQPLQQPAVNLLQMQQQQRAPVQTGPATMNMGVSPNQAQQQNRQSQQAQQASANRYTGQAQMYFNQNQSPTKPYDPVRNPIGYRDGTLETTRYLQNTYGMDWRQQPQFANILMNSNEWLQRRAAWEKNYGNIFVSQDEWTRRNNAAPPGYMWTPFGSSYARLNTAPQTTPTNTGGSYAGGGGYYSNYPNYSGGGGAGYTPKPPEWWVEMVNWRI